MINKATKWVAAVAMAASSSMAFGADTYSFQETGGNASATLTFDAVSATQLTITVDNTSGNASAITGFGFDTTIDPAPAIASWTLTAQVWDPVSETFSTQQIASNTDTTNWTLGTSQAGVTLDYLPQTTNGINYALVNPDCITAPDGPANCPAGISANAVYTNAVLTINFVADTNFTLASVVDQDSTTTGRDGVQCSPYVRMQNTGDTGGGSLKLCQSGGTTTVPEPSSLALLGAGLIGLGLFGRRKAA